MLTLGLILFIWWHSVVYDWVGEGGFIILLLLLQVVITVIGMVYFIVVIKSKYRGISLVIFILLYPIVQFIVQFTVFFFGCASILQLSNFQMHGPPPDRGNRPDTESPEATPSEGPIDQSPDGENTSASD